MLAEEQVNLGAPAGSEMASQEDKDELQGMLDEIKGKQAEANAKKFVGKNAVKSSVEDTLKNMWEMMQKQGIDPANPEEVKKFLDELEQRNPKLFAMIVDAYNQILSMAEKEGVLPTAPTENPAMPTGMSTGVPTMPTGATAGPAGMFPGLSGASTTPRPVQPNMAQKFPNLAGGM